MSRSWDRARSAASAKIAEGQREGPQANAPRPSKVPLLGSNQDSPDPELTRAGLFGGHHVRKWWPAKHRRSQASKVRPGLDRTNACKTLATHSPGASWLGERSTPKGRASVFQMASERRRRVPWPEMSGLPVETAPKAAPLLPTHIRVPSRDALARLPQRSSVLAEPCAMNCRTMHRS